MIVSTAVERPYKGLMPYTERDAPVFFGRDADREMIVANLYAARLTIVYGASGVGKSSLLQAGVADHIHRLPKRAVVVFRNWHSSDPLVELKKAIADEIWNVGQRQIHIQDDVPFDEFLQACAHGIRGPIVVILDQFEEYFLYHPHDESSASFAAQFARAVNQEDCPGTFIVSLREDALAKLDRFERRIPYLFNNYLRIDHLDHDAAREAIIRPLEVFNELMQPSEPFTIEEALVEKIVEEVKIGRVLIGQVGHGQLDVRDKQAADHNNLRIEAPYLQLVLARLWEEERKQRSHRLRLKTLQALGGAERIVSTHVDAAMAQLKPTQREVSAQVFHYLVTPSGTKIAHTAESLAYYANLSEEPVQTVIGRLAQPDLRVLRQVNAAPHEDAKPRYEIFHDVLAPAVLDWRARYFARPTISGRLILLAAILLLGTTAIQFIVVLPPFILTLIRSLSLLAFNTVALTQVYRWFSRDTAYRSVPGATVRNGGPNVGLLLGVLLTFMWFAATEWPADADPNNPLGTIRATEYGLYLLTVINTLFIGFITFLLMRRGGRLAHQFRRNFDSGFYGVYFAVCAVIIVLTLLFWSGYLAPFVKFE